jgi:hypothetical protein
MNKCCAFGVALTLAGAASLYADTSVVFNEIMYHPATNEAGLEWVELHNQMAVDVDISGWRLDGGIHYTFASNSIVRGGGYAVVAISPDSLAAISGLTGLFGPFTSRLSNSGETLQLRNNSGRVVDEVTYGVGGDWPVAPDGSGVSLAKIDPDTASGPAQNWAASEQVGGTPGLENFPAPGTVGPSVTLISADAAWRCNASGSDLGTAWQAPSYSDDSWTVRAGLTNRPVATLFNTGLDATRTVLAAGSSDPHYIITAAAQGSVGGNATVIQNHPAWLANDALSSWIGVLNPGTESVAAGSYYYQTAFSLEGFLPSSVALSISVSADDSVSDVYLNGQALGLSFTGYSSFSAPFVVSNGFKSVTNTLEFRTLNGGTSANPHGFRALVSGAGTAMNTNSPLPLGSTTSYYRKTFFSSSAPGSVELKLRPVIADGAVVYLNGVEVYRVNLPGGTVAFDTPALTNVTLPDFVGWVSVPTSSLVAGSNVLAVEVHQAAGSPDGAFFGAQLLSTPMPAQARAPITVAINELCSATNSAFWLELANVGTNSFSLAGSVLVNDGSGGEYVFPDGVTLAPGGFLALTNATLGFHPVAGDRLCLLNSNRQGVLDAVVVQNVARARFPDGSGAWCNPTVATPGASNVVAFHQEVVINEIMYNHQVLQPTNSLPPQASDESWVEFYNRGSNSVDLAGWTVAGGISYRFAAGTTLNPGAYLVVAKDAAALRSAYPSAAIVGDFSGNLSHSSDSIVLLDAAGNPANSVHYYSAGRWPELADGGGSSLELRDPNADNTRAGAWAASDESHKTSWQTNRYRATAQTVVGPELWNDFILGLLGDGECLVDNISVVQSPDTAPVELIVNGGFENGLTGWRVIGDHRHSRVETDPDNPSNHVLHVVASGPQEHMHNHVECTLTNGYSIANGLTYEVSFRAKWVAGNNFLNTRLYFDRVARTSVLPVPALTGTPGARNSRYTANLGPTFNEFQHKPVIPQPTETVSVSVKAQDPQGVALCQVWWSVNGGSFSSAPMTLDGNGFYTGSIPAAAAGSIVQFYVRAVDGLGAVALYPAAGPDSGALYVVADGQADLSLGHNVRVVLTPANRALLHAFTNVMSNENLPCTIVVDEKRAYYDAGVRLKGSERGRYSDTRVSFHLEFQPDDLFRGVHPVMLVDRSGAGDSTVNKQEEIVVRHMLLRAGGIPGTQPDLCHLIAPFSTHTGSAIFSPRHEDEFIRTAYDNGGDGTQWEVELIYYPTTADAGGYKYPSPDNVMSVDISDLGDDKEIYRYDFILKNHREVDDYSRLIAFAKAFSLASGTGLDAQTRQLMDLDEWLRSYALLTLCGIGDSYTFGGNHNVLIYLRPGDRKMLAFPWDMDFAFSRAPTSSLIGDQNWGKVQNLPGNQRRLYAHVLDVIGSSFNTSYMNYWVSHYAGFAPGQNYADALAYISQRTVAALSEINSAGGNSSFSLSGTNFIVTSNNLVTLSGTAPVGVQSIRINGVEYPITWTSVSGWRISVPVSSPTNTLSIAGYDLHGAPLTNSVAAVTVKYTGAAPDPQGVVVFNEMMTTPIVPDASYVELYNTSATTSFDLSNWRIQGLDYTFPPGSIITNRQYLVVTKDRGAFAEAYGAGAGFFDEYAGELQPAGEVLRLVRPASETNQELVVNQVRFQAGYPWPGTGAGVSLQLVDSAQDNSRVANWAVGQSNATAPQWVYVSTTGTATGTNLYIYLLGPGELYVDDLKLVTGSVPDQGTNLVTNPGFESSLTGTWNLTANFTQSALSSSVKHSGNAGLHVVATAAGSGSGNAVYQGIKLTTGQTHTLSFWYLQSTNASSPALTVRLQNSGITSGAVATAAPVVSTAFRTPGAANSVSRALSAFPSLWINELQAENLTGLTNSLGQRVPWLELYNPGSNAVSLDGLYLSTNYANLAAWAFPAGATLRAQQFKVVFADTLTNLTTTNEWHAGFTLPAGAGSLALSRFADAQGDVLDFIDYTNLVPNRSYGSFPDGQGVDRRELFYPTPAGTNNGTSASLTVVINEWMAGNTHTLTNPLTGKYSDWFELYNYGTNPANLAGYYLTDSLTNQFKFPIPAGYVIPAGGFLLVWADGKTEVGTADLHISFKLSKAGESLGLYGPDGQPVDFFSYGAQTDDVSQGRFPDGAAAFYSMPVPTPRAPNQIPNTAPRLTPIPDQYFHAGQTLRLTVTATDAESAFQSLLFSLDNPPAQAGIDSGTGLLTWNLNNLPAPSTNRLSVRVTDNGLPPLSDTTFLTVIVLPPPQLHSGVPAGNILPLRFDALSGQTYQVQYKDSLRDAEWLPLTAALPGQGGTLEAADDMTGHSNRFYRLVVW